MSITETGNDGDKDPEQIQQEIEETRSGMSSKLNALEQKLSPKQVASDLFDMARERIIGSGDGANHIMDMIKNNPIPVALIGIGLGWMIFSGRSRGSTHTNGGSDRDRHRPYAGPASGPYSTGRQRPGRVESAVDAASGIASRVGERASAYTGKVTDKASEYYEQVADKASGYYDQVTDKAESYYDSARSYAGSTYSRVEGTMQSNPLLVGGIGLAIGAAIGTVLPMTAQEQEYLGEARDHLMQQAEDLGHEAIARARETAEAAGRAAYQEAERHLSGDGQAAQGGEVPTRQAGESAGSPASASKIGAGSSSASKGSPTV